MKHLALIITTVLLLLIILPIASVFASTNIFALASAAVTMFTAPATPTDRYAYGNCTYWVAWRRIQVGLPIPNSWGNAITWASRAAQDGYVVDHTPAKYAIMQDPNALGGEGHVAFVESVNAISGQWTISEMNRVGWDEIDTRTLSASAASQYNFIH